jgi:predicted nucleic acid-binding protein
MFVVIDTNVIVSALLTGREPPAFVLEACLRGHHTPVYNEAIFAEYDRVLRRPKFPFRQEQVDAIFAGLRRKGLPVMGVPCDVAMPDESDRKFYEAAKACNGYVVTGNLKDYPQNDPCVITARDFMEGKFGK